MCSFSFLTLQALFGKDFIDIYWLYFWQGFKPPTTHCWTEFCHRRMYWQNTVGPCWIISICWCPMPSLVPASTHFLDDGNRKIAMLDAGRGRKNQSPDLEKCFDEPQIEKVEAHSSILEATISFYSYEIADVENVEVKEIWQPQEPSFFHFSSGVPCRQPDRWLGGLLGIMALPFCRMFAMFHAFSLRMLS